MKKQLAFIELHQETNSFSSMTTGKKEFENLSLHYGEDIWKPAEKYKFQVYGFREAVQKWGGDEFEILPVFTAWAWSGGPVERTIYDEFKAYALQAVQEAENLHGIYLSLHGAMGVEGMRDPETDLLRAVREVVGPDMPIAVSFDLHANVTQANVDLASFIVGYHTNPHRDFRRVGRKAGELLMQTVRGEVRPVTAYRKLPLLKGGGLGIDFLAPMRGIIRRMKQMERMPGVLCAASFWVHIWMDDEELGWSVVVTTDGDAALANKLADELADRNWAARHKKHPTPRSVDEAIRLARKSRLRRRLGTVVFCDLSDVVGAGAPGANTNILQALMAQAPGLRSCIPVRDPVAAAEAFAAPRGSQIDLQVGGRIDPEYNPPVQLAGQIAFQQETQWGKTAIVRHQGIQVVLTELPFPGYFASDYAAVGINLWKQDITIVKNLFPFRFRMFKYNRRTINVLSRGITQVDVHQLEYEKCPRPIFPLDPVSDWRQKSH